jgi:hypothetical protein
LQEGRISLHMQGTSLKGGELLRGQSEPRMRQGELHIGQGELRMREGELHIGQGKFPCCQWIAISYLLLS